MKTQLYRRLRPGLGATTTEAVLLLVLVALGVMAMIKVFGGGVGQKDEFANDSVGAVSIEDDEMERLRENQRKAQARRKSESSSAKESAPRADKAASKSSKKPADQASKSSPNARETLPSAQATPPGEQESGGFNPFLIPIAIGLLGLLGYVFMKSSKE